jgi:molybdate transport repressor ModE-like protein
MNDLEIRHCRVLVAVSEHGSISSAARALGLSQSTVSETLLSLERLIGASVTVRRRGQEAALTVAAETLLPHARALLSASAMALACVSAERRGVIRLGAVESISSFLLPQALATFRSRWPFIDVRITIGLCSELRRRVVRGELEAAFTVDGAQTAGAGAEGWSRTLAPTRLRLIVARPMSQETQELTKAALKERTFLLPDPDGAFCALLRDWFGAANGVPRMESAGSIDGVKLGVQTREIIGVLPSYAVNGDLAAGTLHELRIRESLPAVALGVTAQYEPPETSPLQDVIRQFEAALNQAYLEETPALRAKPHKARVKRSAASRSHHRSR